MKNSRPTTKRTIEPKALVDYLTPADSDVDDSTATIMPDESTLRASVRHYEANKERLARIAKIAKEVSRKGKAPGRPIGSRVKKPAGIPKCLDQVRCSCGVVFRKGSPAHETHTTHFPQLCRRRTTS